MARRKWYGTEFNKSEPDLTSRGYFLSGAAVQNLVVEQLNVLIAVIQLYQQRWINFRRNA